MWRSPCASETPCVGTGPSECHRGQASWIPGWACSGGSVSRGEDAADGCGGVRAVGGGCPGGHREGRSVPRSSCVGGASSWCPGALSREGTVGLTVCLQPRIPGEQQVRKAPHSDRPRPQVHVRVPRGPLLALGWTAAAPTWRTRYALDPEGRSDAVSRHAPGSEGGQATHPSAGVGPHTDCGISLCRPFPGFP